MITVEKVLKSNAASGSEVAKDNEEVLKTGSVRAVKQSYWPYILIVVAAGVIVWYFFFRKKGSTTTNEGVSG